MSIHLRLILAIGALLLCAIAATVTAVILDARPRIMAESESTMRLTKTIVQSSLVTLEEAADPRRALDRLVESLSELRHVRVTLASRLAGEPSGAVADTWSWGRLLDLEPLPPLELLVAARGKPLDSIVIIPKPADELNEVWDATLRLIEYGVLFSLALVPLTGALIKLSLRPISDLSAAMQLMEAGKFEVRVPEGGAPELAGICTRLNRLAAALAASRAENTALSARMVQIQDEERREIARELHDDLGPHLFAIRARAALMARALGTEAVSLDAALREAYEIGAEIDALQKTNRRVLARLSPAGLRELGLARSVEGMAAQWRKERPDVDLTLDVAGAAQPLSETAALTVYRVCQEGLTNAYRHADASHLSLTIHRTTHMGSEAVRIELSDDGIGVPDGPQLGHGIRGMRERVAALGGTLELHREAKGTRLRAVVPRA